MREMVGLKLCLWVWVFSLGLLAGEETFLQDRSVADMRQWVQEITQHARASSQPDELLNAGLVLERLFKQLNLDYEKQPVLFGDTTFFNYWVEFGEPSKELTVIGAHYDSVSGSVGADDNASSVAVLLSLAKNLKGSDNLIHKVALVFFVLEEQPHFRTDSMGSRVYVQELMDQNAKVRAMVNLEMVGFFSEEPASQQFPDPAMAEVLGTKGDFLALVGRMGKDDYLIQDLLHHWVPTLRAIPYSSPEENPDIYRSDHVSFWEKGIPAIMITDTGELRNPNYHRPSDTIETLDFEKMAALVDSLGAWLRMSDQD